jgi:hypothetical protein
MATLLLQQASKSLASARRGGVLEQRSVRDLMFGGADEEIMVLHAELRAAVQGEERSRKALDDISAALSDVTAEARLVKAWLSEAQVELEATNAEAIRLRAALRAASDERDCYMLEVDECAAAWGDKERVLLDCVRVSEGDASRARQENTRLVESKRVVRDENTCLRDILKQVVAEASGARDSLELARTENAHLRHLVI